METGVSQMPAGPMRQEGFLSLHMTYAF
jgi:hypothetical protein